MTPAPRPTDGPRGPERNPVFDRMRAEHAYVLEALDAIERALPPARGGGGRTAFPAAEIRPLAERLAREFAAHVSAEDDVLAPLLAGALPDGPEGVRRLAAEHAELRTMLAAFLATLSRPAGAARDEQLYVQVQDLIALLRSQIRKEETLVFTIAERQAARPRPTRGEPQ